MNVINECSSTGYWFFFAFCPCNKTMNINNCNANVTAQLELCILWLTINIYSIIEVYRNKRR